MPTSTKKRGLREQLRVTFWILDFYESQNANIEAPSAWYRLLRKDGRARYRLIIRARWHGFDVNETLYLLSLFDQTQSGLTADTQIQIA